MFMATFQDQALWTKQERRFYQQAKTDMQREL